MRKKHFLFAALFFAALAFGFVGCENPDSESGISIEKPGDDSTSDKPSTPEKPTLIATGDVTDLAENSATFWGRLNADTLWALPNVKWGVEYAYDREAVSQHKHQETTKVNCTAGLQGANLDEFSVTIDGLQRSQTIYYSAYILINDMKYVYGELDSVHIVKLTVESNKSNYGTVEGSGYYESNTEVAITATPNYYTEFVQWSDGNTENPRTITITSDVTYIAEFRISYTSFTPAVFSVSSSKQVYFSPGNLQYTQSTNTWSFASAQWEVIGTDNVIGGSVSYGELGGYEKKGTALADKVDFFGWSTSATNFGVSTSTDYNDYSGSFVDWGTNKIGADAPNTWRTLTYDEWVYLRCTRPNASSLNGVAKVNGVNGLILLPDSWTCPDGITFKSGFCDDDYGVDYYAAYQTFTADQWSKLESAGAVFLPAAGSRSGCRVYDVQRIGIYYSASKGYGDYAYFLQFHSGAASMYNGYRNYAHSVRLVKDL